MAELVERDIFVAAMALLGLGFHEKEYQHDFLTDPIPENTTLLSHIICL